jgi:pyruvate,water dikinase
MNGTADAMEAADLASAGDAGAFGGKAAWLSRCLGLGLPVPGGIALGHALVSSLSGPESGAAADRIAAALRGRTGPWAVRSSAVGEDSAQASFAGMHLTLLNLEKPEEVLGAVRRVHASAGEESALAYRSRMGVAGPARMGAVIQSLVPAECAGVLFTRDPAGGRHRVVEAAWGLGPAVVDGSVIPDRFRLSPEGAILEAAPGLKDVRIVPVAGGGTREDPASDSESEALCLSEDRLRELNAMADRCEKAFAPPGAAADWPGLDLEWAFAGGNLYLLQCRPITARKHP